MHSSFVCRTGGNRHDPAGENRRANPKGKILHDETPIASLPGFASSRSASWTGPCLDQFGGWLTFTSWIKIPSRLGPRLVDNDRIAACSCRHPSDKLSQLSGILQL